MSADAKKNYGSTVVLVVLGCTRVVWRYRLASGPNSYCCAGLVRSCGNDIQQNAEWTDGW